MNNSHAVSSSPAGGRCSWMPNIINEGLLCFLEVQPDISDNSLRTVRNVALITWFFMVGRTYTTSPDFLS